MTPLTENQINTCLDCEHLVEYDAILGICTDTQNEHYKHVMHQTHPACGIFFATYDAIEEMLTKSLDNQQVV